MRTEIVDALTNAKETTVIEVAAVLHSGRASVHNAESYRALVSRLGMRS